MKEIEQIIAPPKPKKSLIRMVADFKDARARREQRLVKSMTKNPA